MATVITKAVAINFRVLRQDLQEVKLNTQKKVAELLKKSLQAQVDAINDASSNRKSAIPSNLKVGSGTVDKPLAGATVDVRITAGGNRVIGRVNHSGYDGRNLFDILDQGRESGTAENFAVFPSYSGHVLPVKGPSLALGNPNRVKTTLQAGKVSINLKSNGKVDMVAIRPGHRVRGFKGKQFYQSAAGWVQREIVAGHVVNRFRRSSVRLKKADVKIIIKAKVIN